MRFEEGHSDGITFIGWDEKMNPIMPEPEVGKIYHGFDVGDIYAFTISEEEKSYFFDDSIVVVE